VAIRDDKAPEEVTREKLKCGKLKADIEAGSGDFTGARGGNGVV